ncbi:MAG: deoxyguanosinetriphosphate triphosphohydrolase [Acutalibacteraceae bacterium]
MNIREQSEQLEHQILSPYAAFSDQSKGRVLDETPCEIRTAFQRDRDRIIHCKAFRRLKHKTQVFLSPEGDHYRTRLTHTLEVSQIARTIASALRLNEYLTEAIALGHDLGHTPFGHAGEAALNDLISGGFRHFEQSVRVVERLEKNGQGLNLTYETKNGILCHTRGKYADTLEGQIVRIADRIAYINHDIDDAIRGGIISEQDISGEITDVLGQTTAQRINTLVRSLIQYSKNGVLSMNSTVQKQFDCLHDFMFEAVYESKAVMHETRKIPFIMENLYRYFMKHQNRLPKEIIDLNDTDERAVCDYLAGMTDHYAVELFKEIYVPKSWK